MHLIGPPEGSFEGPSIYPFQEMNDDFDAWILWLWKVGITSMGKHDE